MWKWIIIVTIYFNTTLVHGGGYCDDFNPLKCGANGKCINNVCVCDKGYYGDDCSAGYCEANPNPCKNGGTCETIQSEFSAEVYKCNCSSGFTGYNCSECESTKTCQNGGTCVKDTEDDSYYCSCKDGYFGVTCANQWCDVNQNPCKNGGTCQSDVTSPDFHSCQCAPGYYGDSCEDQWCDMNPNTCENGGTCQSNLKPPEFHCCQCTSGYYGDTCKDEYCEYKDQKDVCKNGANCTSLHVKPFYSCTCTPEYEGMDCTDPVFYKNGDCQYHINDNTLKHESFDDAKDVCGGIKGALAMDKDASVHKFISDRIREAYGDDSISCWIGGSMTTKDEWEWLDNTTISLPEDGGYENWKEGEPNESDSCMEIRGKDGTYEWSGRNCDEKTGFICEIPVKSPCEDDTCANGKCIATGCQWRCQCDEGYFGERCENNLIEISSPGQVIAIAGKSKVILVNVTEYEDDIVNVDVRKDGVLVGSQTNMNVSSGELSFNFTSLDETSEGNYTFTAYPASHTYSRSTTTFMIIHVRAQIVNVSEAFIFAPVTTGPDDVECEAYGKPEPSIGWFRDDVPVPAAEASGVYQTNDSDTATLHVEAAILSNDGEYICRAENQVGEGTDLETVIQEESIKLAVYGSPSFGNMSTSMCTNNAEIFFAWKPNNQTDEVPHRFNITSVNSSEPYFDTKTVIYSEHPQLKFTSLQPYTEYQILAEVCPNPNDCIAELAVSSKATTGHGTPTAVQEVQITRDGQKNCTVTWEWPTSPKDQIENFKVKWDISYVYQTPGAESSISPIENTLNCSTLENTSNCSTLENTIEMKPNRQYVATVTAKTCAGEGPSNNADGACKTDSEAPEEVPEAIVSSNGKRSETKDITIQFANETNGYISCTLVIVSKDKDISEDELTTLESIRQFQDRASSQENLDQGYLAMAITRDKMTPGKQETITLGDSETTSCDMLELDSTMQARDDAEDHNSVVSGINIKLDINGVNYSITTVTVTPKEDDTIALKPAKSVSFINGKDIVLLVVLPVIFSLLIIGAITGFLIYRRRAKKRKDVSPPPPPQRTLDSTTVPAIYENMEMVQNTGIPLANLKQHYEQMRRDESMLFREEYKKLRQFARANASPATFGSQESNMGKNRYKNIIPYDHSRIQLTGEEQDSYINACLVHGGRFIAAQGPLPNTVYDFWRMIIEQKCSTIVMLTDCTEGGKRKCEQYWPELNEALEFGAYSIRNCDEKYYGAYVRRDLRIYYYNNEQYAIQHYKFLEWPDHGVPTTTSGFFRLHERVMAANNVLRSKSPILVHCSAGVGRTGTFIGFDILLEESRNKKSVDIYGCVMNMRKDRIDMVQSADQYEMLHKLLLETYLFGETDVSQEELQRRKRRDKRVYDTEFDNLRVAESLSASQRTGDANYVTGDRVVVVRQPEDTEWITIDATYVEAYDHRTKLIAAQAPTNATVEYFWRATLDNKIDTIVMLNDVEQNGSPCVTYWPTSTRDAMVMNRTTVYLLNEENVRGTMKRTFRVSRSEGATTDVVQYQCLKWSTSRPMVVIELLNAMESRNRGGSTILVHCRNGLGRTGVFCALCNIADRIKQEGKVDVFRTVKDLKDLRPGIVETKEDYKFCYELAQAYVTSRNVYENTVSLRDEYEEPVYQNV